MAPGAARHSAVTRHGEPVAAGEALTISSDTCTLSAPLLDFGSVESANFPAQKLLRITNTGTTAVTITSAYFTRTSTYSVSSSWPRTIAGGDSAVFLVLFNDPGMTGGRYDDSLVFVLSSGCVNAYALVSGIKYYRQSIDAPTSMSMLIPRCTDLPRDTTIVIANYSANDLVVASAVLSRDTSFSFRPKPMLPLRIPPGRTDSIGIRFNPRVQGDANGALTLVSNAANSPIFVVALLGVKETAILTAMSLYFDAQRQGDFPVTRTFPLHNAGTLPITVDSLSFGAAPPFTVLDTLPIIIPPNATHNVRVRFDDPLLDGYYSDSLSIAHSPSCEPLHILVTGSKVSLPTLDGPESIVFRTQQCTPGRIDTTITIENTGEFDLTFSSATITGDTSFTLLTPVPFAVRPHMLADLRVRFDPQGMGPRTAVLTLANNSSNAPSYQIALAATVNRISMNVPPLDFGIVPLASFPVVQRITIRNNSDIPVTIDSATFDHPTPFKVLNPMPDILAPGDTLALDVRFSDPGIDGKFIDNITLHHHPICSIPSAEVVGTRTSKPRIDMLTAISFTLPPCEGPGRDTTIEIRNIGADILVVQELTNQSTAGFYLAAVPLPLSIPPGGSYPITIRYQPPYAGPWYGMLVLKSNAPNGGELKILLSAMRDSIGVAGAALDFGTWRPAQFPLTRMLTVTNTGTIDVTIDSLTLRQAAPYTVLTPTPFTLKAGETANVSVRFSDPASDGTFTDSMRIWHSPSCRSARVGIRGMRETRPGISVPGATGIPTRVCDLAPIDTVIRIDNTGDRTLHLIDAWITGDAGFSIPAAFTPADIAPNSSLNATVRFTPSVRGLRQAVLSIRSDADNDTLAEVPLSADVDDAGLAAAPVDFGTAFAGEYPVTRTLTLRNTGTVSVTIFALRFTPPDPFVLVSGLPAVVGAGDSVSVIVRMSEPATDGTFAAECTADAVPLCSDIRILFSGTRTSASAELEVSDAHGGPGDTVTVAVRMRASSNLQIAQATGFTGTLRANRSLLVPLFSAPRTVSGADAVYDVQIPAAAAADGTLARFPFRVVLGADTTAALSLGNLAAVTTHPVPVTSVPGRFSLDGVCREGGARLFDATRVFTLVQNRPNPFNPLTTISFATIEAGRVTLRVYDLAGRLVSTLVDDDLPAGARTAVFDGTGLPSGVYRAVLTSGTLSRSIRMVLAK